MKKYDVLVCGGGFAGVGAAIAAARQGASVLLVESSNALGGAAVNCLVNPFMPYTTKVNGERFYLSAGIFSEICDELIKLTHELDGIDARYASKPMSTFSEEYLKIVLNRMTLASGVELLFHTSVVGVRREGRRLRSVIVSNIGGLSEIEANCFIDCSGDASLAVQAGYPTRLGRDEDRLCQPMTLCFRVGDVNVDLFMKSREYMQKRYKELQAEGKIKNIREDVLLFRTTSDNVIHFNTTRIVKRNPIDPLDVTAAEIEVREQVYEMFRFLKTEVPGCENARLLSTAMHIGVRESRMIDGEYLLTKDDLLAYRHFEDGIAACNYDIDIHNPEGSGTSHFYFPDGCYYTIPYRCLIPRGSENLLVAGRCISSTHEAQASYRIMPTVCTLGEAAGVAAALTVRGSSGVSQIDVSELRRLLRENGAVVD